VVSIV